MESAGYAALSRQSGLMREMQVIANNIANAQTSGFRQEGVVFSEYLRDSDEGAGLAMAAGRVRNTSFEQGALKHTGAAFDLAIEGDGFFVVETPNGPRLTRAGAFTPDSAGQLVTPDGYAVLDQGGAPVVLPAATGDVAIAEDGTISSAGTPVGRIGVVLPENPLRLTREGGVLFDAEDGFVEVDNPRMRQGYVEGSNVDPILQIARMSEVQRAYEMGQAFMDREDERIRSALKAFVS
ncbi:flagellar hook-basal body complex protein [Thalassococcus sp. CAU 1522]|uniref:Flagellar basal-body rod protein FlgF n=1 Tax=Thalassococcus arenae TaxID=2851652 RepID=A0ABS6N5N9_9RHOB|nr:flagellar hook-basal body complex protein [Thalassococcus arenae]MBV2359335.1 flagellar hook-basal body complex protein [Thalassococcus arenae]